MLVLSAADVERLLDLDALVDAVGKAMAELSAGRAVTPPRVVVEVAGADGFLLAMPAFLPAAGALTTNRERHAGGGDGRQRRHRHEPGIGVVLKTPQQVVVIVRPPASRLREQVVAELIAKKWGRPLPGEEADDARGTPYLAGHVVDDSTAGARTR